MNYKFLAWTVGGMMGLVIVGSLLYVFVFAPPAQDMTPTSPVTLPGSGPFPVSTTTPATGDPTRTITGASGEDIVVNDFINNGTTIPDELNSGDYLLAGNLGYCAEPSACQAATAEGYTVYYHGESQLFNITLTEEPLGETRLRSEEFVLKALGIPKNQLCNLNYRIGVTAYVNEQYAGKNLGFSFCPGATQLPR